MKTHVLPPWRGGEGGSELDGTLEDNGRSRSPRGSDELENIFDDFNDKNREKIDGNAGHATERRRGGERGQPVVGNGSENDSSEHKMSRRSRSSSENKAVDGDRDRDEVSAQHTGTRESGSPSQQNGTGSAARLQRISSRGGSSTNGGMEDFVLTDGSSEDELSSGSRARSNGGGMMTRKGSRLRNETPNVSSETAGGDSSPASPCAGVPDRRRHSSGPTPAARSDEENDNIAESGRSEKRVVFSEGPANGGRRASSTPQPSRSENQNAEGGAGPGAATCRRHTHLKEGQENNDDAAERSSEDQVASRDQQGTSTDGEPSPSRRPSILVTHQSTAASTVLAPPGRTEDGRALTSVHGSQYIGLHGVTAKDAKAHGGAREEECTDARGAIQGARFATCVATAEMDIDGTPPISVAVSGATAAASRGEVAQLEAGVVVKEERPGDDINVTSFAGEHRQPLWDGTKSSALDQDEHRPSTVMMMSTDSAERCGEEKKLGSIAASAVTATTTTDSGSTPVVGAGSGVGGSVKGRGGAQDLSVLNDACDSPPSGATTSLMQAVAAGTAQDNTSNEENAVIENSPKVLVDKSAVAIRSPLEVITEVRSGESSGDSFNDRSRGGAAPAAPSAAIVSTLGSEYCGGAMRMPYCLSPTNVMRQARGSGATAAAGSSCRERERLVARIQLSAGVNATGAAAAASGVNTGTQGAVPRPLPLNSSTAGSCFDGGFTPDRGDREGGGGWASGKGSPLSYGNADNAFSRPAGKAPSAPEHEERGGGWLEGSGAPIESDRCSSSSPSARFYLPSSETKTAPLCGAGGSTSLYEGSAVAANKSTTSVRGGEGAWCFPRVGPEAAMQVLETGHRETTGMIPEDEAKKGCGVPRLDQEQLAVSLWKTFER